MSGEGTGRFVCILHNTSRSKSRGGSHISHEATTKSLQLEIDRLKRKLHQERCRGTPSSSDHSSDGNNDSSYRHRSRTPQSESFSYDEEHRGRQGRKSPSRKGLGNDAISRALNQISKLPFTRKVEEGRLPRRFTQPRLLSTVVGQTQWSTWAIWTREWLCIPKMKLWCAKCFHPT